MNTCKFSTSGRTMEVNDLPAPKQRALKGSLEKGDFLLKIYPVDELSPWEYTTVSKVGLETFVTESKVLAKGEDKLRDFNKALDNQTQIPTPDVTLIDETRFNRTYTSEAYPNGMPDDFIRLEEVDTDESDDSDKDDSDSEYDLDTDDEAWIEENKELNIGSDLFETVVSKLNKLNIINRLHPILLEDKKSPPLSLISEESFSQVFSYWIEKRRVNGSAIRNPKGPNKHRNQYLNKAYRAFHPSLPVFEPKVLRSQKKKGALALHHEGKKARKSLADWKRDVRQNWLDPAVKQQEDILSLEKRWTDQWALLENGVEIPSVSVTSAEMLSPHPIKKKMQHQKQECTMPGLSL